MSSGSDTVGDLGGVSADNAAVEVVSGVERVALQMWQDNPDMVSCLQDGLSGRSDGVESFRSVLMALLHLVDADERVAVTDIHTPSMSVKRRSEYLRRMESGGLISRRNFDGLWCVEWEDGARALAVWYLGVE